jgi:hypothetical protein
MKLFVGMIETDEAKHSGGPTVTNGIIRRYDGDGSWTWVTLPADLGGAWAVLCTATHGGYTYIGVHKGPFGGKPKWAYEGYVYRSSSGGKNWEQVGGQLDLAVTAMVVHNGELYAGTAVGGYEWEPVVMRTYRLSGNSWSLVYNHSVPIYVGIGDWEEDIEGLQDYVNNYGFIRIPGETWPGPAVTTYGVLVPFPYVGVGALASIGGHLYQGDSRYGIIYRDNSYVFDPEAGFDKFWTGSHRLYVSHGGIKDFAEHNGVIYAGHEYVYIYSNDGGLTWSVDNWYHTWYYPSGQRAFCSFKGDLYSSRNWHGQRLKNLVVHSVASSKITGNVQQIIHDDDHLYLATGSNPRWGSTNDARAYIWDGGNYAESLRWFTLHGEKYPLGLNRTVATSLWFARDWNIWVKKSNEWKDVPELWVKKGGSWNPVTEVWTKKGGVWNPV